jgi:hypothetical protein
MKQRYELDGYRLVSELDALTDAERREVSPRAVELFQLWTRIRGSASAPPQAFAWAHENLRCRTPVLERASADGETHSWGVRLLMPGQRLGKDLGACLGCAAVAPLPDLPDPLAWLSQAFGTATLELFTSGTAPWGRTLGAMLDERALLLCADLDEGLVLPPSSRAWVVLYEINGDAVCADLVGGGTYWTGGEQTGERFTDLELSWGAALQFILWRLIDHRFLGVKDLKMMSAALSHAAR